VEGVVAREMLRNLLDHQLEAAEIQHDMSRTALQSADFEDFLIERGDRRQVFREKHGAD
jgi:hypothetical protein